MQNKILIWGTGEYGERIYNKLIKESYIIKYWGDNNKERIGADIHGVRVLDLEAINNLPDGTVDIIVIASQYSDEIYKQLMKDCTLNVEIYKDPVKLTPIPFSQVYFDISGRCNAKCKYCVTGFRNLNHENINSDEYITAEKFEAVINHMLEKSIVDNHSNIALFDWGEPFLNPQLEEILLILYRKGLHNVSLSTNASIVKELKKEAAMVVKNIVISMPGFSQASYDKIHGFNFETIKKNICKLMDNFMGGGICSFTISYHVYQFSMLELNKAAKWAKDLGITIRPNYAYMNDLDRGIAYCEQKISYNELHEMGKDLCLIIAKKKENNRLCSQQDILTINEKGELLLCCGVTKNSELYSIGNILDMDITQIKNRKKDAMKDILCQKCKESGFFDWISNNGLTEEELNILMGDSKDSLVPGYFED